MDFKALLAQALAGIEDEALRAKITNEIEQAHAADVAGLKDNNDKLINEKKTVKAKLEAAEKTLESLGDASVADLQNEITELKRTNKELMDNPGDETKIKELERKHETIMRSKEEEYQTNLLKKNDEILEREKEIEGLNTEIEQGLAQRALSRALDEVGVQSDFKAVLQDALSTKVFVESVGDERKVKIKQDGLPYEINDGLAQWARDVQNKKFLGATNNRGAGSNGSKGTGVASKAWEDMTIGDKNKLFTQDKDLYYQMKANYENKNK